MFLLPLAFVPIAAADDEAAAAVVAVAAPNRQLFIMYPSGLLCEYSRMLFVSLEHHHRPTRCVYLTLSTVTLSRHHILCCPLNHHLTRCCHVYGTLNSRRPHDVAAVVAAAGDDRCVVLYGFVAVAQLKLQLVTWKAIIVSA